MPFPDISQWWCGRSGRSGWRSLRRAGCRGAVDGTSLGAFPFDPARCDDGAVVNRRRWQKSLS